MSLAYRCEVCDGEPNWKLVRIGDVVVSWACDPHLAEVGWRLQRDHEVTELVITDYRKSVEWAEITQALEAIASGTKPNTDEGERA